MTILSVSFTFPCANSEMYTAAPRPTGTAISSAMAVTLKVPTMSASAPKLASIARRGIGNPARAGEELHPVELRHHRRGLLEDEEEDRDDADDRAPAADANEPLDRASRRRRGG